MRLGPEAVVGYDPAMSKEHLPKLNVCQNCETPTPGNYCPECGQDSRDHRVALRLLVVGLWNDLFTFDNRFWRSIVLLLFRPGALTNRFVAGQRIRYIPPARMYLFISLVFFFLVSAVIRSGLRDEVVTVTNPAPAAVVAMADSIRAAAGNTLHASTADMSGIEDSPAMDAAEEDDGRTEATIFGREFDLDEKSLVGAIVNLVPKGMFLLLPIFAALLALVYRRSRRKYVEHLIFSLHFHAFVFILLILTLATTWPPAGLVALALVYVYLYLAMKRVYGQGWRKTWLKHFLLTNAYNVVFFVFVVLVLVGGVHLAAWAERYPRWLGWAV